MTEWLKLAIEADSRGRRDEALDIIFDKIDDMMWAGKWSEIDRLFGEVPDTVSTTFMGGMLSITLPGRDRLPSRPSYFDRTWLAYIERGRPAEKILSGLK